ncbi:amidohydrolase family protein [Aliikangiella marina]|uniref:Amidohydrolase family protein n=1 Tax=Aliikangiella marina TaxID=1712262 RepID=A0A545TC28_9GAMM|nr:amidohydrolase family protein [Aliikangiella marina]TQV74746.1 amidohydrolase family protein [Aliikangiella marina]
MKAKIFIIFILLFVFFWWLPEPEEQVDNKKSDVFQTLNASFIISNANIYDGFEMHKSSSILVENNRVIKIAPSIDNPSDYPVYNAAGKALVPGLIDAHTHVWGGALSQALNFGVTTELDMFTSPESAKPHLISRTRIDNTQQADLFSATILATAPGGHGTEYGMEIPVLSSVDQVADFVNNRVNDGADYIKAVYNAKQAKRQHFPSISLEILEALAKESSRQNKMLVVHVDNLISAKHAIAAGASGIIHSFMDTVADDELIELMKQAEAFIIPTFAVQASISGHSRGKDLAEVSAMKAFMSPMQTQQLNVNFANFGIPQSAFRNSQRTVLKLHKAGIVVLAGSDAPNPGTTHGVSLHDELAWLVESGLTPEQALHAATGAVSRVFPVGSRGTLQPGALASMVLIGGDPLSNIADSLNIEAIWKNGVYHQRKVYDLDQRFEPPLAAGEISRFEESDELTSVGAGISESTDQLAGGKSAVTKQLAMRDGQNRYLKVTGQVNKGFSYPWSGITFVPGKSFSEGANLSELAYLVFDAKGEAHAQPLSVLLFQTGSFTPAVHQLKISREWKTYKIPLAEFEEIDIRQVVNISIVATTPFGDFEFGLDNLKFEK